MSRGKGITWKGVGGEGSSAVDDEDEGAFKNSTRVENLTNLSTNRHQSSPSKPEEQRPQTKSR